MSASRAPSSAPKRSEFRDWLIDRVKDLPFEVQPNETVDELTLRLGIRPEIYIAAQERKLSELRALGREPKTIGSRRKRIVQRSEFCLNIPAEVFQDFDVVCTTRGFTHSHLLRAVINTLLLGSENPKNYDQRTCYYRGKACRISGTKQQRWPHAVATYISFGARVALQRRADYLGTTPTALVRCKLVEVLEGKIPKLFYVNAASMFGDPEKYWTGKKT